MAVPLEACALFGFLNTPIDVGFPPGTSPLWMAYGLVATFLHLPTFLFAGARKAAFLVLAFIVGYAELFSLMVALVFGYRFIGGLVSRASASK